MQKIFFSLVCVLICGQFLTLPLKEQLEQKRYFFGLVCHQIRSLITLKKGLKWYESDGLLTYIDESKCKELCCDRDADFDKIKVFNFNIIYSSCNPNHEMNKSLIDHQTIKPDDFCNYLNDDKALALSEALRCQQNDAFMEKSLLLSRLNYLSKEKI